MKILFFDMEFANGKVPGSIYSLGYVMTDENFEILLPQTDLLINPDSAWNEYVAANILAYPIEQVEAAPKFPELYEEIRELFDEADMAVGFALNNDTGALLKNCERYGLKPLSFFAFDTEKLCRLTEAHREAHGLAGCVKAWCGLTPENQHRSDGDAYATMLLLRAICDYHHVNPDMMFDAYPECISESARQPQKTKIKTARRRNGSGNGGHRRSRHRSNAAGKQSRQKAVATDAAPVSG